MSIHPVCRRAFTLIELICVISIIALLASLLFPVIGRIMDSADSTKCANNLRQVGASVNLYAAEHNNTLPVIETSPDDPVYPEEAKARPMGEVLGPYGVTEEVLKCPADVKSKLNYKEGAAEKGSSFFAEKGTSYEWRPHFDGEPANAPKIYTPRGNFNVPLNRVRLALDFVNGGEAPHQRTPTGSAYNTLLGDGAVRTLTINKGEVRK